MLHITPTLNCELYKNGLGQKIYFNMFYSFGHRLVRGDRSILFFRYFETICSWRE